MKKMMFLLSAGLLLMSVSGCSHWFQDDRPVPAKPPYEPAERERTNALSPADAVNAMTTAISIKSAVNAYGPFVFVADKQKPCSKYGREVLNSLIRMRLSSPSARMMLVLYDEINAKNEWTVKLVHYKTDTVFFARTIQLAE